MSRDAGTPSLARRSGKDLRTTFPSGDLCKGPSKDKLLTMWPKDTLSRHSLQGDLGLPSLRAPPLSTGLSFIAGTHSGLGSEASHIQTNSPKPHWPPGDREEQGSEEATMHV